MKIEVYLDGRSTPLRVIDPPETFDLNTRDLSDGKHQLTLKAIDEGGSTSVREISFVVRNGPGIAVHGIRDNDIVAGEISVLANAYSSRIGDIFEPMRIETPAPIPTWAWLIVLIVFAWGMWYLATEYTARTAQLAAAEANAAAPTATTTPGSAERANSWRALGKQVFENNCASCHQVSGEGVPGVFPSLKANTVVMADDATEHVLTVLNGLAGKAVEGIAYTTPMPPFAGALSDDQVAAVVNHERSSWGNSAHSVTPEEVSAIRRKGAQGP